MDDHYIREVCRAQLQSAIAFNRRHFEPAVGGGFLYAKAVERCHAAAPASFW
jgi:hypothetical protein